MADYEVIPQAAIDHLLANPTSSRGFDQVFGAGRAAEVFSNQTPVPEAQDEDEEMSAIGALWDATGRAVGFGAQEALNETADAFESVDIWAGEKLDEMGIPSRLQFFETNEDGTFGDFNPQFKFHHESAGDIDFFGGTVGEAGDISEMDLVDQPSTMVGGFVSGISQFVTGMALAGKFTKLSGLRGAFVNGAIADAIVFDPNDPNITKMLEHWDIDTGVVGEVPSCGGLLVCDHQKEELWDKFYTGAPRLRTQSELLYSDRKLRARR